ncbi:uncharacterized protein [Ptychodera flava]|uniref:uncharacterized protein isoform X2 n=1 Tax=Ptychodera flava TaxID=63121 RepID=UPI00396A8AD4
MDSLSTMRKQNEDFALSYGGTQKVDIKRNNGLAQEGAAASPSLSAEPSMLSTAKDMTATASVSQRQKLKYRPEWEFPEQRAMCVVALWCCCLWDMKR